MSLGCRGHHRSGYYIIFSWDEAERCWRLLSEWLERKGSLQMGEMICSICTVKWEGKGFTSRANLLHDEFLVIIITTLYGQ